MLEERLPAILHWLFARRWRCFLVHRSNVAGRAACAAARRQPMWPPMRANLLLLYVPHSYHFCHPVQATRPLASAVHHGIDRISTGAAAADVGQDKQRGGGGGKQREGWDISKMAPKLKGER